VLKREMELAMLDAVVEQAAALGIRQLRGRYIPTSKNAMVADHYRKLGFEHVATDPENGGSVWTLSLSSYSPRNRHIQVLEHARG
jgi:predicted enzyme involved in methoxymalonyl-ACP biosynthesis